MLRFPWKALAWAAILALWHTAAAAQPWRIVDPGQGGVTLDSGKTRATELSGITWAGRDQYYAVSDNRGRLFPLSVDIDKETGRIRSAVLGPRIELEKGQDLEGVVYREMTDTVLVSDEKGAHIREHAVLDGSIVREIDVPAVFRENFRQGFSLESLSGDRSLSVLWTANEEALRGDWQKSSFLGGTLVRLQKFDSELVPAGQWVYATDPIPGDFGIAGRDLEVSGVADLVALPGDGLLVLERAFGARTLFRGRLYLVDFTDATDVSDLASLKDGDFTLVGKELLWETTGLGNYEGAALGRRLDGGDRSLLLVSDDGGAMPPQRLYALRLTVPCGIAPRKDCPVPEPADTGGSDDEKASVEKDSSRKSE